jgi:multiple antibiotic resistance protein
MSYNDLVEFVVAMVIMMNPLAALSSFIQLTRKDSYDDKRKAAFSCGLAITIIMVVTIWIGESLLYYLGITVASFRFAGGIILLLMGLSMLQSKESAMSHTPEDDSAAKDRESIAVVPMALPIIIGPGAISTLIITTTDFPHFIYKTWLSLICCLLALIMTALLYHAATIAKMVGASTMKVITRIMGMLIMAIASGMLAAGLTGLFPVLR